MSDPFHPDIPVTPVPYSEGHYNELKRRGYTEEKIEACTFVNGLMETKRSKAAGEAVVALVNSLTGLKMEFVGWCDNYLDHCLATFKERQYRIIGCWCRDRYFPKGCIKRRGRKGQFTWLMNGQAATGAIQVGYWGETVMMIPPTFTEIVKKYYAIAGYSS